MSMQAFVVILRRTSDCISVRLGFDTNGLICVIPQVSDTAASDVKRPGDSGDKKQSRG